MYSHKDYRDYLKTELALRCQKNPAYSLRAFARDLDMTAANLSYIFNNKRSMSKESATKVARLLGLNNAESEYFYDLVQLNDSKKDEVKNAAKVRVEMQMSYFSGQGVHSKSLSMDSFKIIADWYHLAILQVMTLKTYKDDSRWIATQLGIAQNLVDDALQRLERLELIYKKNGRYHAIEEYVLSPDGVSGDAIRKFHEQVLNKATQALYTENVDNREYRTSVFPMNKKDIPAAKRKIKRFIINFVDEFKQTEEADTVYAFSTQLFNLTPGLAATETTETDEQ